jgi:amino acid permease
MRELYVGFLNIKWENNHKLIYTTWHTESFKNWYLQARTMIEQLMKWLRTTVSYLSYLPILLLLIEQEIIEGNNNYFHRVEHIIAHSIARLFWMYTVCLIYKVVEKTRNSQCHGLPLKSALGVIWCYSTIARGEATGARI